VKRFENLGDWENEIELVCVYWIRKNER